MGTPLANRSRMITVSEYTDISAVAQIRDLWRELWWKTPQASVSQSVEWFEHYCRHLGNSGRFRVLLVSIDRRPTGLVPWIEKRVRSGLSSVVVLSYPLADDGLLC